MIHRTLVTIWFLLLFLSLFGIAVQLADGGNPLASEGLTACLVLWAPAAATVLVVAFAIDTHRIWHLLKWLGFPVLNCHLIDEDEHHGRMDLD